MNKFREVFKEYWLFFIVVSQPVLDVIAYFTFDENVTIFTFIIRTVYFIFTVVYTFIISNNKKQYFASLLPFGIFCLAHLINSYRTCPQGMFNDIRYMACVMQFPILTIAFSDYLKKKPHQSFLIEKGINVAYIIIFVSVLVSVITNTYEKTYFEGFGITGWFTSANTQSMILCILSPIFLYYNTKKKEFTYALSLVIVYFLLYFNGTKSCYYTLIFVLIAISYILFTKAGKNKYKLILTICVLSASLLLYDYSYTRMRSNQLTISKNSDSNVTEIIQRGNLTKEEAISVLKTTSFKKPINDFGEDKVYELMKNKMNINHIYDDRELKKVYGRIIFDNSDFITKLVGYSHQEITNYGYDVENDFTGIFYYYGYIGFSLYIGFILYFAYKGIKTMLIKPVKVVSSRFVMFTFTILLGLFAAEQTGALIRKPNSNIYFALFFAIFNLYISTSLSNENIKIEPKDNKVTFLALHLGYGGIESSIINTANALCDKYEVVIMSFYNLAKNQTFKLNNNIKIDYLYSGGPNKNELDYDLKHFKIISLLKNGYKAINILYRKKYSVIKYIINCDSRYVISTRSEFNKLLSKYGNSFAVKIAQEHQYHNNDKKYIDTIRYKYDNIDYLLALTKTLESDYQEFVSNNKKTKVVLLPNMLCDINDKITNLNSKNVITVSRLDKGKRVDEMIKMFIKIKKEDSKFFIIGDGAEYGRLSQIIKENNLQNQVILTGYKTKQEIEKFMLDAGLFMMSSISEGLPMVLLEAMSYGVPCIAYRTASGVADIITDGYNGFVIENRNEEEFIEKAKLILNDKFLQRNMSINAKESIKRFSKEEILKKWYEILK